MNSTGLQEKDSELIIKILKSFLKNRKPYKVNIFGSRAIGTYKKYSDIDLWIESQPDLNRKDISELSQQFEESDLTIKVDIVTPETVLAEYSEQIKSQLVPFYTQ